MLYYFLFLFQPTKVVINFHISITITTVSAPYLSVRDSIIFLISAAFSYSSFSTWYSR